MDFWFCHKPHDEGTSENGAHSKGFSSRSKLAIEPGIGMTDLFSIALHNDDCLNIKVSQSQNTSNGYKKEISFLSKDTNPIQLPENDFLQLP